MRRTSPHTLSTVLTYENLSAKYQAFTMNILLVQEPKTYNETIKYAC